jgi:uncharacterized protein (DUF488 family)
VIYTVGHSTHRLETFAALLRAHAVSKLADVRTFPMSRRHPHFNSDALAESLAAEGIRYRHFRELGGFRKPQPGSINTAWRHPAFRGYADYMQTAPFAAVLASLRTWSEDEPTAVMCAEALWWKCHRRLLADALEAQGVTVCHIDSTGAAKRHEVSQFARIREGKVTYPGLL